METCSTLPTKWEEWITRRSEFIFTHSYGHLLAMAITVYKWDYTFYKWGFVSTYNWYFGP